VSEAVLAPVTVPILQAVLDWTSTGGAVFVLFGFFSPDDMVKQQNVSGKRKKISHYIACRGYLLSEASSLRSG